MLAADLLGSYGSMAAIRNLPRVFKVNDCSVIAGSGDYADYQLLLDVIRQRVNSDYCANDGYVYKPKELFSWCTRVLYNRRSSFDPLWNRLAIAGFEDGKPWEALFLHFLKRNYYLHTYSRNSWILKIPWLCRLVGKFIRRKLYFDRLWKLYGCGKI